MGSLQDQLVKAGLADDKPAEQSGKKRTSQRGKKAGKKTAKKAGGRSATNKGRRHAGRRQADGDPGEVDLRKAYQAKARAEKSEQQKSRERELAEQERRRKRNLELDKIVAGKILNDESAETPRYFPYMGKIRKIDVTEDQLHAVNNGELGIAVLRSRAVLLDKDTLERFRELAPDLVPDLGVDADGAEQAG